MREKDLVDLAKQALEHAYAPYSNFKVGVALVTKDGKTFTGCNVESASYGLSVCAERVAVIKAISSGSKDFEQIAIVVAASDVCSPCGSCRQLLYEFNPDIEVIMANTSGKIEKIILRELLPHAFARSCVTEE